MPKYTLEFRGNLADFLDSVRTIMDSTNSFMNSMGFSEKAILEGHLFSFDVETDREMTEEEKRAYEAASQIVVNKTYPGKDIRAGHLIKVQ